MAENTPTIQDPIQIPTVISNQGGAEQLYALLLDGTAAMTVNVDEPTYANDALFLVGQETDRFVGVQILDPTYYIRTGYDINSKVSLFPANSGNNGVTGSVNDDIFTLDEIKIAKTATAGFQTYNDDSTTYNFPSRGGASASHGASYESVNIINVSTTDDTNGTNGTAFVLNMNIGVTDQGLLVVQSNDWSGANVDGTLTENVLKAQSAYWTNDSDPESAGGANADLPVSGAAPSALAANDDDNLSATLTLSNVQNYSPVQALQQAAKSAFQDQDVVDNWTITIDAIGNDHTGNNLSAWARTKFRGEATPVPNDSPFAEGDQIVARTPHSYTVTLDGNTGTTHTLIPATDVYGVVYQLASSGLGA